MVRVKGLIGVLSMLLVAACATGPEGAGRGGDPIGALIDRETQETGPAPLPPGPPAGNFLDQNISLLERRIGSPALVRREGVNEFRRYDLERCRIYAIVSPAGGNVQTLRSGPVVTGATPLPFRTCTSGL
jgi:hypothetical protein